MNSFVLAQEAGGTSTLLFLALMIGVFYFLIIRPQRKRAKEQRELAASLQVGQDIRTVGGIHGRVISADDDSVVLSVEEGKIRISRRAVGSLLSDEEPA